MSKLNSELLSELEKADRIIHNALQIMTMKQRNRWGIANEKDRVSGEGVTRKYERTAAISKAKGKI